MNRRVLSIVHTESSCGWGGREIHILTEMDGMVRRSHRLTLICPLEARVRDAALARGLDVVALPKHSHRDNGFALETMACGLALVSTPVGAIGEAVVAGETGLLVPPKDARALSAAMGRLMGDAELRARFGAAGYARAQACFGSERMLNGMEHIFLRFARSAGR